MKTLVLCSILLLPSLASAEVVHHHVKAGETLQRISMQYFGTTRRWHKIFDQNRTVLPSPDAVAPGMTLSFEGPAGTKAFTASAKSAPIEAASPVKIAEPVARETSKKVRRKIASFHPAAQYEGDSPEYQGEGSTGISDEPVDNIGGPMVQPDYVKKRGDQSRREDRESTVTRAVASVHPPMQTEEQSLVELVAKAATGAIASAHQIQPQQKLRQIASESGTNTFQAIDSDDEVAIDTPETPADPAPLMVAAKEVPARKHVSFRFGSKELIGPEL